MTSSPSPTPMASSARCRPAVAEFTATASTPPPMKLANSCSKARALGPVVSQPDLMASVTAVISASPMSGSAKGMKDMVRCLATRGVEEWEL
ncbi:hypothetical protein D3C73_1506600 [compost metagenome]